MVRRIMWVQEFVGYKDLPSGGDYGVRKRSLRFVGLLGCLPGSVNERANLDLGVASSSPTWGEEIKNLNIWKKIFKIPNYSINV